MGRDDEMIWVGGTERLLADEAFGRVVASVGPVPRVPSRGGHFEVLVRTIVYQQLAGKAAATIHGRVITALGGEVSPQAILAASDEVLREAGLSRNKLAALRDLSDKAASGEVPLDELEGLADEEVIEQLVTVRGIGRWTAEMFLIFQLLRPDIWPVGDLGVRHGWALIHALDEPPSAKELQALGDPYRPWRSAAAWYCYRAVDLKRAKG